MKKRFIYYAMSAVMICSFIVSDRSVFAVNDFYSSNDINFYDAEDTGCASGSPVTGSVSLEKSEQLQSIFQTLTNGGMNSIQAAAIMGNIYAESGFNSDTHEVGNDIGYGLAQWSFGRRVNLENFAKEKNVAASDVNMQLEFLFKEYSSSYKSKLKGTDFDKSDIGKATESWMMIFEAPAMIPENDPARLNSKRIPAAQKIYNYYKDLSPSKTAVTISTVTTSNCSNGAVAGNIVATALNFALESPVENGKTEKSDARMSYQTAKESINPSSDWSDCGGFVATVMIASGVDPDYPKLGVAPNQTPYVRSHPEKYKIIESISGSNDLQPGDILLTDGHTVIYTGRSPYPVVDASLGERVPSVQSSGSVQWMIDRDTIVARVIK